jgi:dTDP-4-amino-4,6-dideoxygalactose transaminase
VTHVILVHFFGRVSDLSQWNDLVTSAGAQLIEDAAQHAGGTFGGSYGGGLGRTGVLSFGRGKGIHAGGGVLLRARDSGYSTPAPLASEQGAFHAEGEAAFSTLARVSLVELLSRPELYFLPSSMPFLHLGETRYHAPSIVRPMGVASLSLLPYALDAEMETRNARRSAESLYLSSLSDIPALLLSPLETRAESGALRFPVLLRPTIGAGLARRGVSRPYPRLLDSYEELAPAIVRTTEPLSGSKTLSLMLHTLPTHSRATTNDRQLLVAELRRALTPTYRAS